MNKLAFSFPIITILCLFISCNQDNSQATDPKVQEEGATLTPVEQPKPELSSKELIQKKAKEAMSAIAKKDVARLAALVHPSAGLRISPYPYIDTKAHQQISKANVARLTSEDSPRLWGTQDGSGDPIRMSFDQYYAKYIYNKPYQDADTIGYDKVVGGGNAIYNYKEVYPGSVMIEYFLPGSHPDYGGMDWGSLILVFVELEGDWYLRSLAHGQWTS